MVKTVKSEKLKTEYVLYVHPSGLTCYFYNMPKFSSYSCIIGTNYGSVDNCYKNENGETVTVPHGIAHFLEHKMFENEDGDAFYKFAETGAYSNAFTSFDRTCYLFSCSSGFEKNLDILLDMVTHPYFTEQTVKKEQGIIGEEITMYDDMPTWCVFHNALTSLYKNHPVNIDIPGTKETISKITPELLYSLYNKFYVPSNMFLAVAGPVDTEKAIKIIDKYFDVPKTEKPLAIFPNEPSEIVTSYTEKTMDVAKPLFCFGYKLSGEKRTAKEITVADISLKLLSSIASDLNKKLLTEKLIDDDFSTEFMYGREYGTVIFTGASDNPKKVAKEIHEEIERLIKEGIESELFTAVKNGYLGSSLRAFNSPDSMTDWLIIASAIGAEPFSLIEDIEAVTEADCIEFFKTLLWERSALSVIKGRN